MTEQERETANLYKQMFDSWAWKDFSLFLESLANDAMDNLLNFDQQTGIEFKIGQIKGELECLRKIKNKMIFTVSEK